MTQILDYLDGNVIRPLANSFCVESAPAGGSWTESRLRGGVAGCGDHTVCACPSIGLKVFMRIIFRRAGGGGIL